MTKAQSKYSPPRRGGEAQQLNRSWRAGVVSSAETFCRSSIEASPYRARALRHPVCASGASTPPLRGGECTRPKILPKKPSLFSLVLLCLALIFGSDQAWGQKPGTELVLPSSNMTVTTRLDRTAVWPGDQFHYLIIVEYPADYEFVLDNLTKETVNMDPFQVIDVAKSLVIQKNSARRLFVDLTLANFATGQTSMQIPQFTLYYFRKSDKTVSADQAAAESLSVPGPVIGIRSTLPSEPEDIRDAVTLNSWNHNRWMFAALAWLCGAILVAGLGREAALFVRRMKARKGPDRRKAMEALRTRWFSHIPSEFTDAGTCLSFYDHSSQSLKEYMGYYLDTTTIGLTADEMRDEMQRLGVTPDLTQKVARVLEVCERLRYARDGMPADTEAARSVAEDMQEILKAAR